MSLNVTPLLISNPQSKIKNPSAGRRLACLFFCFCAVLLLSITAFADEVKVPVAIALQKPVAGAQFKFSHTDGLEFVSFERSDAVKSAIMTPIVAKDGYINVGFFGRENSFIPQGGALDAGYLVFNHSGAADQSVAMTEVKLVEVIDKDTTNSELITDIYEIKIPLSGGEGLKIGFEEQPSIPAWMILIAVVVCALLCLACIVIIKQRRMLRERETPSVHL